MIGHSVTITALSKSRLQNPDAGARGGGTQSADDEALMAAYVAGDMSAFSELFRRYARPGASALAFATRRSPDFVQQTFLHLHRARASFTVGACSAWLLSIAINLQREHFRASSAARVHPDVFTFGSRAPTGPDVIYEAERACRASNPYPRASVKCSNYCAERAVHCRHRERNGHDHRGRQIARASRSATLAPANDRAAVAERVSLRSVRARMGSMDRADNHRLSVG